jgi:enoyl-CoA hydratase/carnithine racemase
MNQLPPHKTKTLFSKDGISLVATTIRPDVDGTDDDDHNGIILTLYLHRHTEKNVINPTMISLLVQALHVIDTHPLVCHTNNKALIITGIDHDNLKTCKFFGNGLDLDWMMKASNNQTNNNHHSGGGGSSAAAAAAVSAATKKNENPTSQMIEMFNSRVLAKILTLPFRTVAAINGHCIGAGLFLALACDYRLMRTQRGYIQWPEARLGMRLTKGFAELSKDKIGEYDVLREGLLTAKRYTSGEALASGIIDGEYPLEELYAAAFQLAMDGLPESGDDTLEYFDPKAFTEMKMELWCNSYRALKFGKVSDLPHSRI